MASSIGATVIDSVLREACDRPSNSQSLISQPFNENTRNAFRFPQLNRHLFLFPASFIHPRAFMVR